MMSTSHANLHALEQGPVIVQALQSLSRQDADIVGQVVANLSSLWTIELHYDYDGYLSILVLSVEPAEEATYILSGTVANIELSTMSGDTLCRLGCYNTIRQATLHLRNALADASGMFP